MIDLDAIEGQAQAFDHDRRMGLPLSTDSVLFCYLEDVPDLVAELRAARHIIGPAKAIYEDGGYDPVLFAELGDALVAYDKATGEAHHAT